MPHQCTSCQSTFPDGSKEMLSGCPNCGGNTFQYIPKGADPEDYEPESQEPPEPPVSEDSVTGRVGRAASSVREYVNSQRNDADVSPDRTSDQSTETTDQSAETESAETDSLEDRAQASARGEVADISDLRSGGSATGSGSPESGSQPSKSGAPTDSPETPHDTSQPPREDGRVVDEPNEAADTDIETLRAELNDQFESIRIVEPGQYELNLMELYDREEHIVALREDGKYVIEVPETWRDAGDSADRS